jgi:hypothetical protein
VKKPESLLGSIEAVVNKGKAVVSADNSIIIAMMQEALKTGRSVTFYVPRPQAQAVMRWFLTPALIKEVGLEPVSKEERSRIESELGVKDMGPWFSNRIQCPACGGVYGAFEFVQQGLRVHGKEWVGAVVELKNAAVLRVNPAEDAFCPKCNLIILQNHWYAMYDLRGTMIYGCCRGVIPRPIIIEA